MWNDLISGLQNAGNSFVNNIVQPVESGIGNAFNAIDQGFKNYIAQPVENTAETAWNAIQAAAPRGLPPVPQPQQTFNPMQPLINSAGMPKIDLGQMFSELGNVGRGVFQNLNPQNNPINQGINSALSQTPGLINKYFTQPVTQAIPGGQNNVFSNIGRNAVGDVGGLLSLPGTIAQVNQNPSELGNIAQGILQNYQQDFGFNPQTGQWSLGNVGQNLQQRPLNTILDLLPAGALLGKAAKVGEAGAAGSAAELPEEAAAVGTKAPGQVPTVNGEGEPLPWESATANLTPKERLANALNYPAEMRAQGFTPEQIDNTSAPQWQQMKDQGVTPQDLASGKNAADSASLTANNPTAFQNFLNKTTGGLRGVSDDVKSSFANWVNGRRAAQIQGMADGQPFQKYDQLGTQALTDFEKNPSQFPDVQSYFQGRLQQLKQAGIKLGNWGDNYIPYVFEGEEDNAFQRNLNPKNAPFTQTRNIPTYEEAINKGLVPAFNTLSDLAQWYGGKADKLLADNRYFKTLANQGIIQPATHAPSDFEQLGQGFPLNSTKLADGSTYTGVYSAPKTLADAINNYLKSPDDLLSRFAGASSRVKNTILAAGIPKTGLTFHGLNELTRQTLFSGNPISGWLTGVKYLANPGAAQDMIDSSLGTAAAAVKQGLNLNIEDHNFIDNATKNTSTIGKGVDMLHDTFSRPLFQQTIPALKLQKYQSITDDLVKSGMDQDAAEKMAARQTNNIYGGQNLEQVARSKQFQNILKSISFAPDWAEGNIRIGTGIAKSLINPLSPEGKVFRTASRNLVMSYVAANMLQKQLTGSFMFQNPVGKESSIDTGQYDSNGQKIYVEPFGTGTDFVQLPFALAHGLLNGYSDTATSMIRNRLNPVIGAGLDQITNQNYAGKSLYPKYGATMGQQALGRFSDAAQSVLPPQVAAAGKVLTGQESVPEGVAQAMQLPIRYGGAAVNSQPEQDLVNMYKQAGAGGQQINQALGQYKQQQALPYQSIGAPTASGQSPVTMKPTNTGNVLTDALNTQANKTTQKTYIDKVFSSNLNDQQKDTLLTQAGINPDNAKLQLIAGLNEPERVPVVNSIMQQASGDPSTQQATFAGLVHAGVMTSSLVTEMQKEGMIDPTQKKTLDALITQVNGGTTSTGSSTSRLPLGAIPRPSTAAVQVPNSPAIKAPTMPTPSTKSPFANVKGTFGASLPNISKSYGTPGTNLSAGSPFWENVAQTASQSAPKVGTNPFDAIKANYKIPTVSAPAVRNISGNQVFQ